MTGKNQPPHLRWDRGNREGMADLTRRGAP